jgi:putative RNA 2'-phosphotransferase
MDDGSRALVRQSRRLSFVLRHEPASVGLTLDSAGWVDVAALLGAMHLTSSQLDGIVETNDKKRFEFSEDKTKIRASQGHSIEVDLRYEPAPPPGDLYHGTSTHFLDSIFRTGIDKRDRHHVHLSADAATAMTVARRRPKPVVLTIHALRMADDGHTFYRSTNGVWLTESVPRPYIAVLAPQVPFDV